MNVNWISLKEELPPKNLRVMLCTAGDPMKWIDRGQFGGDLNDGIPSFDNPDWFYPCSNFTHWSYEPKHIDDYGFTI
jgi:hypothetical protein